MEEQPQQQQAKRRRRPSVRLGEIGFAAPYDASSLWIEAPRQRRKTAPADVLSTGKPSSRSPGAKAPRIRPLEQLGRAEDAPIVEEEWGVVEPTVADGASPSPAKGKPRRTFNRKPNTKLRGKAGIGGGRMGWASKEGPEAPVDVDSPETREDEEEEDEEEEDEEDDSEEKETLPLQADDEAPILSTSDSEELLGSDVKGEEEENLPADDSGNAGSDGSEEGEPGVKRSSHGEEMQGAIEDGPLNGKVFSRGNQRPGERRSGRQAAIRAIRDIASIDTAIRSDTRDVVSRDTASRDNAGEPSGRFQSPGAVGNGTTTIVTPNSSQRGLLSAGVSGWLQELGLGKYSELFELNEVDTEVLPHLTFEDLREMGVDAVGARRKMFNGIQELGQIRGI